MTILISHFAKLMLFQCLYWQVCGGCSLTLC